MSYRDKNLKDSPREIARGTALAIKDVNVSISYTKTNKLVSALYMVTDVLDRDEPLRSKLRTLAAEIILDVHSSPLQAKEKIRAILSLLDIAREVGMISGMNFSILSKEFVNLQKSIQQYEYELNNLSSQPDLSEFLKEESLPSGESSSRTFLSKDNGHPRYPRVGIQKGSTLMGALRKIEMSDRESSRSDIPKFHRSEFDSLKKDRRDEIASILKIKGWSTITDIKSNAQGPLLSSGDKTLQRELISMVKDGVLNKRGEKRWSQYSLKQA